MSGNIFETFVVSEIIKSYSKNGISVKEGTLDIQIQDKVKITGSVTGGKATIVANNTSDKKENPISVVSDDSGKFTISLNKDEKYKFTITSDNKGYEIFKSAEKQYSKDTELSEITLKEKTINVSLTLVKVEK